MVECLCIRDKAIRGHANLIIDVLNDKLSLRKVLGYLPQSFGVYPKMSAEQLLNYLASLKGIQNKKERSELVQELLEITNLYDVRDKNVDGYSGGMKQRFGRSDR